MDDDLDPAFLDLDLPSHHSNGGGNDSLELGAGFGSQLDLDLDLDDDSPQLELGAGFGNALGAELDGLELDEAEKDDLSSGTRSRHSSGGGHGSALSVAAEGDGYATPRRRNGSGSGHGRGMSLADELASASGPPGGRTRDLMRELGIEEDEEGEEERHDGEERESEEDPEEQLERRLFGAVQQDDEGREDPFGLSGGASSPARRPGSRLRTKQSMASFAVGWEPTVEEDEEDEDALGISQEELDAALQEAAEALESSIATTGTFLSHLRQHVTGEVAPSSAPAPPPPAPPFLRHSSSSATLLTGSLQRSTSTPSPSSDLPSTTRTIDYTDRQPVVESLASSVLKQLYDVASQREVQLRELTEMERVFARSDLGWQAVLAGLDPLPNDHDDEDEDEEEERDEGAEPAEANGVLPLDAAFPSSPLLSPTLPPPTSSPSPPTHTLSPSAPLLPPLTDLRTLTSSLLSALSSISDLSQVQSALSSDAGRKLRALKAQVGGVREELLVVERSEGFVREFEEREKREGGRRESCAEQARKEVEAAREALEEGWTKAQSVFQISPPPPPVAVEVGVAV